MPSSHDEAGPSTARKRTKYSKRACQHCQRRKVKCNGQQPCEQCASTNEECVYLEGKARGGARTRGLSTASAQTQPATTNGGQTFSPHLKIDTRSPVVAFQDPSLDLATSSTLVERVQRLEQIVARLSAADHTTHLPTGPKSAPALTSAPTKRTHDQLSRLLPTSAVDRQSNRSGEDSGARSSERRRTENVYYGHSSTLGSLHSLKDKLCSLAPASSRTEAERFVSEDTPEPARSYVDLAKRASIAALPSRQVAYPIIARLFDDLMSMYPLLHAPMFYERYAALWTADGQLSLEAAQGDAFTNTELALLYAGLAAAGVLMRQESDSENGSTPDPAVEAKRWCSAARTLLNDCWDLPADLEQIQTCCLMSLYYLNVEDENLSYKLTGLAVRCAYEIGLHLRSREAGHSPYVIELRRRAWWCLYLLDRRTSVSLGRPASIHNNELDVDYPTPLDDSVTFPEQLERTIRLEHSKIPYLVEFVRFSSILGDVYEKVYGVQAICPPTQDTVRELDATLEAWRFNLPLFLRFNQEIVSSIPTWLAKQQLFLHLRCAHVRLLVLRPFVQEISESHGTPPAPGSTAYRMAQLAISLSSEIIHTIAQVKRSSDLIDFLWYPAKQFLLTTVCIIFTCVLGFSDANFSAASCKADVRVALQTLKDFSHKSTGSRRTLRDVQFLRYMCNQALRSRQQGNVAIEDDNQQAPRPVGAQIQPHPAHLSMLINDQNNYNDLQYQQPLLTQHFLPTNHDLSFLNPYPAVGADSSDLLMSVLDSGDKDLLPTTTDFGDLGVALF